MYSSFLSICLFLTATNRPIIDKQMLLRLLFKQLIIKEGKVTCIPNEPFSFILGENKLKSITNDTIAKSKSTELQCTQCLEADFEGSTDSISKKPTEPYTAPPNTLIYKEKNCSEKQFIKIGWQNLMDQSTLKTHRNAVVSCKDQLKYAITRFGLS